MKIVVIFFLFLHTLLADGLEWFSSYEKALEHSSEMKKPVMLLITMKSCHACDVMKKRVFTQSDVNSYMQNNFTLLEVDISNQEIPKRFRTYVTPTFEFIDSNEESIIDTVRGAKKAKCFLKILQRVITHYRGE